MRGRIKEKEYIAIARVCTHSGRYRKTPVSIPKFESAVGAGGASFLLSSSFLLSTLPTTPPTRRAVNNTHDMVCICPRVIRFVSNVTAGCQRRAAARVLWLIRGMRRKRLASANQQKKKRGGGKSKPNKRLA